MMTLAEKMEALHDYGVNLDKGIIYVAGDLESTLNVILRVKYNMIVEYQAQQLKSELKEINIVLNSGGGDIVAITSVLDFFDDLKKNGVLVNVHAEGVCMSAATFILAGATGRRTAGQRCRFMVHEMQLISENTTQTQTQAKSFQAENDRIEQEMYSIYADISLAKKENVTPEERKKAIEQWEKVCKKEFYFGVDEALTRNMIDEVV